MFHKPLLFQGTHNCIWIKITVYLIGGPHKSVAKCWPRHPPIHLAVKLSQSQTPNQNWYLAHTTWWYHLVLGAIVHQAVYRSWHWPYGPPLLLCPEDIGRYSQAYHPEEMNLLITQGAIYTNVKRRPTSLTSCVLVPNCMCHSTHPNLLKLVLCFSKLLLDDCHRTSLITREQCIGSSKGLVSSGNKPLPESILTQINVTIFRF